MRFSWTSALRVSLMCCAVFASAGCEGPSIDSEPASLDAPSVGLLTEASEARAAWHEANLGIEKADVRALAIDPRDPRTLYAGTLQGGLYKTKDGGHLWRLVGGSLPRLWIKDVAVDPVQADIVYVATSSGVYKSTDGGLNFLPPTGDARRQTFEPLVVAPSDPNVLYVRGTSGYLLRSEDAGVTWSYGQNAFDTFVVSAHDARAVYGIRDDGSVYKTSDGGRTFARIDAGLPASQKYGSSTIALDPRQPGTIYVGISGRGLFRSEDDGQSWSAIGGDVAGGSSYGAIAFDPASPQRIFLSASVYPRAGSSFVSEDGGLSFADAPVPGTLRFVIDPTDSNRIYLYGPTGVFRSCDGLASYEKIIHGFDNLEVRRIVTDAHPGTVYFSTDSEDLYVSWTGGALWRRTSLVTDGRVLGLVADPTRAGTAYVGYSVPPRWEPSPTDPAVQLAFSQPGKLFATHTSGWWWRDITGDIGPYVNVTALAVAPDTRSLLVGASGEIKDGGRTVSYVGMKLLRTRDHGRSWQVLTSLPEVSERIWALSEAHLVAAGATNGLLESTDGGITWARLTLELAFIQGFAVDPDDPQVLYASSASSLYPSFPNTGLRKSRDGGRTWFAPNDGLRDTPITSLAVSPVDGRVYVAAREGDGPNIVFVSEDRAETFVQAFRGLEQNSVNSLAVDPRHACVAYAGTRGQGVFVTWTAGGTCSTP